MSHWLGSKKTQTTTYEGQYSAENWACNQTASPYAHGSCHWNHRPLRDIQCVPMNKIGVEVGDIADVRCEENQGLSKKTQAYANQDCAHPTEPAHFS